MATKYPDWAPQFWRDNWCGPLDDGVQDVTKAGVGDAGVFTFNSNIVTLDTNEACDSLDMSAGGSAARINAASGAHSLDVGGAVMYAGAGGADVTLYCGGSFEAVWPDTGVGLLTLLVMDGTGTLTTNGVTMPPIEVNAAGAYTLADELTCKGFTFTAGEFEVNGQVVNVDGDLLIVGVAGFVGHTGAWVHRGGDLQNDTGYAQRFGPLTIGQGGKSTTIGAVRASKLTIGAGVDGVAADGGHVWTIHPSDELPVVSQPGRGTVDGELVLAPLADVNIGALDLDGCFSNGVTVSPTQTNKTVTVTGDWNLGTAGTLRLWKYTNDQWVGLRANGYRITCASLRPGYSGQSDFGKIWLGSGSHSIGTIEREPGNLSTAHELHFDTGTIALGTLIDGDGMTCTNTSAVVVGGTVDNCDLSGQTALLHLWPATAGTGNTNVLELAPFNRDLSLSPGLGLVA